MIVCNFVKGQGLLAIPEYEELQYVEWHGYCGPTLMTKDWHASADVQPDENSDFWALMNAWNEGGFQVDKSGLICISHGI